MSRSFCFCIIQISAVNLLERLVSVCKVLIAANFTPAKCRLPDYKVLTAANTLSHLLGLMGLCSLNQTWKFFVLPCSEETEALGNCVCRTWNQFILPIRIYTSWINFFFCAISYFCSSSEGSI